MDGSQDQDIRIRDLQEIEVGNWHLSEGAEDRDEPEQHQIQEQPPPITAKDQEYVMNSEEDAMTEDEDEDDGNTDSELDGEFDLEEMEDGS